MALREEHVILVRQETSPEDVAGMHAAQGVLTSRGGLTSHAAVVARGWGKSCVVGAGDVIVDEENRLFRAGRAVVREGQVVTLNGATGEVVMGALPLVDPKLSAEFRQLLDWARKASTTRVRANADTPDDAAKAREFEAEGIGLVRTEHMFFKDDRIPIVREMIMARDEQARRKAVDRLLPFQREDFIGIFTAMNGYPVTIRLLDPPLHEFLPKYKEVLEEYTRLDALGINPARHQELGAVKARIEALQEANPMLGHRGCRLGITFPEIYEMQVRAIMEAACEVARRGVRVEPEIMIPLTGTVPEMKVTRDMTVRMADKTVAEMGAKVGYTVGTMIEVPRAALIADKLAEHADFFSFGTNDLTQMTFGYSRDDIGKFLPFYLEKKLLPDDPFAVLDQEGVGEMIEIGIRARPQDEAQAQGGHLRRARRRAVFGRVLSSRGHGLRLLLSVHGADRVARVGPGADQGEGLEAPEGGAVREFHGVYVPVPTPFRGDAVAAERLKANLGKWNETPLSGYVVLGSTGEFPMLSESERDAVLVAAREAIPRDKAFIAGTGTNSTLHTIRQTKRAAEIGADAAIVITPHYFTKGFAQPAAQVRHYLAVAEASPIPVMLYNFPLNTGINLEPDTVARIAEHPNVCGIKDSSGNIPQAAQIIHLTPKTFHVMVGSASALLPALRHRRLGRHPGAGGDRRAGVLRGVLAREAGAVGGGQRDRGAHGAGGPGRAGPLRHRRAQGGAGPAGLLRRARAGRRSARRTATASKRSRRAWLRRGSSNQHAPQDVPDGGKGSEAFRRADSAGVFEARGRGPHLRPARRRRAADLRRPVRLRRDPPHPRPPGGGRRARGRGLLPHHRPDRRLPGHLGPRGDQPGDGAAGRPHGLDPARRLHGPGADAPDRQRRLPGGRQRRHHALRDQAQFPGQGRQGPRRDHQGGLPHRLHRPPGPGARGPAQGHPGQGVALRVPGERAPALLQPDLRRPPGADQEGRARHRAGQAPRALRGRRRHLVGRLAGALRAGRADAGAGDPDPHGPGRLPDGASAVARHAGHARDVLRQHGRPPFRLPRRGGRALRRPRHRAGGRLRSQCRDHPHRHRSVVDLEEHPGRTSRSWGTASGCSPSSWRRFARR